MMLLIKLALAMPLIGWLVHANEIAALALIGPMIGILLTRDIMNLAGGSYYIARKHAYDSDTRVFKYGYATQVRMIMHRNRAWFSAAPICEVLGHRDVERTVRHYATTEYCVYGLRKEKFLPESGVRRLAEISRSPEAQSFLRWFDIEVAATLERTRRRTQSGGAIATPDIDISEAPPDSPDRPAA
ncbi:MAG: hypothetical protein FJY56_17115 [Betaproteobacteria bacterium]|nr:hypothetical protein [Betaproteobacteria bacterium]